MSHDRLGLVEKDGVGVVLFGMQAHELERRVQAGVKRGDVAGAPGRSWNRCCFCYAAQAQEG